MSDLRLFIVDDEQPARERLKTLLSDIAMQCHYTLVGEADNAETAMQQIAALKPNLILLDVQMPGMTGIEMANVLSEQGTDAPAVIFVSAYDQYALHAFEVQAIDYLLKPVRASRLADALQRASIRLQQAQAELQSAPTSGRQHFSVQDRGRVLLVPIKDVLYLKAEQKYVTLRTKRQDFLIEDTLVSIENEMAETFVRVHRNALVSRKAIIGVERSPFGAIMDDATEKQDSWEVILRDVDERLPISRRQWPVVKALVR